MATDGAGVKPFVTSFQGKTQITSNDFLVIFKKFDKDGRYCTCINEVLFLFFSVFAKCLSI